MVHAPNPRVLEPAWAPLARHWCHHWADELVRGGPPGVSWPGLCTTWRELSLGSWRVAPQWGGAHYVFSGTGHSRPWRWASWQLPGLIPEGHGSVVRVGVQEIAPKSSQVRRKAGLPTLSPLRWCEGWFLPLKLPKQFAISLWASVPTHSEGGLYIWLYREIHEALGGKLAFFLQ